MPGREVLINGHYPYATSESSAERMTGHMCVPSCSEYITALSEQLGALLVMTGDIVMDSLGVQGKSLL